jgi:hypothetical protein
MHPASTSTGASGRVRFIAGFKESWLWIVLAFLGFNLLTAELYPSVWMDEVMFTQPAANLHLGRGFTSTAWPFQSGEAFWVGNAPLHPLLLAAWFKVAGFGIYQTRLFNYLLWSAAVVVLCVTARRFGWVTSGKGLSLLVVLLSVGQGVAFSFRSGRYDSLAALLVSLCLLASSLSRPRWRYLAIFAAASLFLPACLTLGPLFIIVGFLLVVLFRWKCLRELTVAAAGLAAGLGLLFLLYRHFGVWDDFLKAIKGLSQTHYNHETFEKGGGASLGVVIGRKARDVFAVLKTDKSGVLLMLAMASALVLRSREEALRCRGLVMFSVAAFFAIPVCLLFTYAFPLFYSWMRYLPLCLAFASVMENVRWRSRILPRPLFLALTLLVISAAGLGGQVLMAGLDWRERDYQRVENFVEQNVRSDDVVYASYQAFYPLQRLKARAYYSWYMLRITPEEAATINCLVIAPDTLDAVKGSLGGEWESTGQEYLHAPKFGWPLLDRLMPNYFATQTNLKYNLAIYRRTKASAASRAAP